MGVSLKERFAGIEKAVVQTVQASGIDETMVLYGVKHRETFLNWLANNTNGHWQAPHPLANLKGGSKMQLLRDTVTRHCSGFRSVRYS